MSERVVLINPPATHVREKHYEYAENPRIGLAYLAAYLRGKGVDCDVIDAKYERLTVEDVLDRLRPGVADIIGMTAMTPEICDCAEMAARIRGEHSPVMVIGGPHATALPEETLAEFKEFDIACVGEGEETLYDIVSSVRGGGALGAIPGIVYRDGDGVTNTGRREFMRDLDSLPGPAWDLFPASKIYPILASRGCPARCNFCMRVLGGKVRFRTPEHVVREMEETYERYDPSFFKFYDETFGVNKEYTGRLLDGIIASGLNRKIKWSVTTRVDVLDERLFRRMKDAGCEWVSFGIESGNENVLKSSAKNITKEKAKKAVAAAKKAGLKTWAYFILGHPDEDRDTLKETIDFASELDTLMVSFGLMVPYPGTRIWEMALAGEGGYRLLSRDWKLYNKQTDVVLELKDIDQMTLKKYQLRGYLKFFLLRPSIAKTLSLFREVDILSVIRILFLRLAGR